jgi:hypothetical protein
VPYASKPSPADVVAAMMRRRGIELDPMRLQETAAAERSRQKVEHRDHIANVRAAASAAVKARRALSLAQQVWIQSQTDANHASAVRASAALKAAQEHLNELCLNDGAAIAAALRKASL